MPTNEEPANLVTVEPSGCSFPVGPGESVFAAAARAGLRWPTICGGNANCGTCVSELLDGEPNCAEPGPGELETLQRVLGSVLPRRRLACRLTVSGPVTLRKRGVRT